MQTASIAGPRGVDRVASRSNVTSTCARAMRVTFARAARAFVTRNEPECTRATFDRALLPIRSRMSVPAFASATSPGLLVCSSQHSGAYVPAGIALVCQALRQEHTRRRAVPAANRRDPRAVETDSGGYIHSLADPEAPRRSRARRCERRAWFVRSSQHSLIGVLRMRLSSRMISEVVQPFWEALQRRAPQAEPASVRGHTRSPVPGVQPPQTARAPAGTESFLPVANCRRFVPRRAMCRRRARRFCRIMGVGVGAGPAADRDPGRPP
jgi:hypothetical protein